ncbi:MAG: ABC transporter permease [Aeromicrobium sp.]
MSSRHTRHSQNTVVGLMLRHVVARRLQMGVVAAIVVTLSFLAAVAPRALETLLTDQLHHDLGKADTASLDLTAKAIGSPSTYVSLENWSSMRELLAAERARLPEDARRVAGTPGVTIELAERTAEIVSPARNAPRTDLVLGVDPVLDQHVRMVEGSAPAPVPETLAAPIDRDGNPHPEVERAPVDFILSRAVAKATGWQVGDIRRLEGGLSPSTPLVRLSGIFEPKDPKGDFWSHTTTAVEPAINDASSSVSATGWIDPESWPNIRPISGGASVTAWIPLHSNKLRSADARQVADDLAEFTQRGLDMPRDSQGIDFVDVSQLLKPAPMPYSTEMTQALQDESKNNVSTYALALMLALGPLLAGGCAMFLGSGVLRSSQRFAIRVASARGASDNQVRAGLAVQGLLAGIPAAAVGWAAAVLLVPGEPGLLGLVLPALVALTPAVALAAMPLGSGLSVTTSRRVRRVAEICIAAATIAAIVGLRQRGLSGDRDSVDLLLTAAPALLSLVGCLVALRLVGPVANAIRVWRGRGRGLVSLVGSARAAGQATMGLPVALALVSGVAVAVFSSTTLATLQGGVNDGARATAGADLRVTSTSLTADSAEEIAALPGVNDVAAVSSRRGTELLLAQRKTAVTVFAVDSETLQKVQSGFPLAPDIPPALKEKPAPTEPIPLVLSSELRRRLGPSDTAKLATVPARVVGVADANLAFAETDQWVLVDRKALDARDIGVTDNLTLLIDAEDDKTADVRKQIAAKIDGATISTPATERTALEKDPRLPGLRTISIAATSTAVLLILVAIALALVGGAEGRARDVAVAHALGLSSVGSRWLPVWEVGPLALVSAAVGLVVGIVTPVITLAATNLAPFTGGITQPGVVFRPMWTVVLLVGVLALAVVASLASVLVASRRDLAASLRMMED